MFPPELAPNRNKGVVGEMDLKRQHHGRKKEQDRVSFRAPIKNWCLSRHTILAEQADQQKMLFREVQCGVLYNLEKGVVVGGREAHGDSRGVFSTR